MKLLPGRLTQITDFIQLVQKEPYIYIQLHDFPDPDAVASGYGLQYFFSQFGIHCRIIYEKVIQRDSLKRMISDLHIDIRPSRDYLMKPEDKIVLVDGCKGNSNVTDLIGNEVGVIDHHQVTSPEDIVFSDIRPDYGACATIVATYFWDAKMQIPPNVATAIMIGIQTDTALLTRGVSLDDLQVFYHCYPIADMNLVNSILRNNISISDLAYYKKLIDHLQYQGELGFCYFPDGCDQNLLGILSNFVLSLEEISFVVLCAKNDHRIHFSVRNENPGWNAAAIIQSALKGIGFGGGHADMAGGIIPNADDFQAKVFFRRITSLMENTD